MGSVRQVYQLLNELDVAHEKGKDVIKIMIELSEIVEREVDAFSQDSDPFDKGFQSSSLGQIKEAVSGNQTIEMLIAEYTEICGVTLKTALCRLLLAAFSVFDGHLKYIFRNEYFVLGLFQWAENGPNPLRSLATGLLAEANRLILYSKHRAANSNLVLVPLMIRRLYELGERSLQNINSDGQMYNLNYMGYYEQENATHNKVPKIKSKYRYSPMIYETRSKEDKHRSKFSPISNDLQNVSNSCFGDNVNNTSYQVFPLTPVMEEMYILKYLTSVKHYQEFIEEILKENIMTFILRYIDLHQNHDLTLAFEALKYFASLLRHISAAIEFLNRGGLQLLLKLRCSALVAAGVSQCIYALGKFKQVMLMICMEPSISKCELVNYALWLLECPYKSCQHFAAKFLRRGFRFKAILEHFDQQDGLKKLFNVMRNVHRFGRAKRLRFKSTSKHICKSLNSYFEAHLAALVNKKLVENCMEVSTKASITGNLTLRISQQNMKRLHDLFLTPLPQWNPVDEFININGINILLQLIASYYKGSRKSLRKRVKTITYALDILKTCSLTASTLLKFCEEIPNPDYFHLTGVKILLEAAKGQPMPVAEVQRSALLTIINCVCFKTESLYQINPPVAQIVPEVEVVLHKIWEIIIYEEGISHLVNILYSNAPLSDAYSIRALACKALCGLARLKIVKQILSGDPLITKYHLIDLMKEPVHQDKCYYSFRKYGLKLIEIVTDMPPAFCSQSTMNLNKICESEISENSKWVHNEEKNLKPVHDYLLQKCFITPYLQSKGRNILENITRSKGFVIPPLQNKKEESSTTINSKECTTLRLQNEKEEGSSSRIKSEGLTTSPIEFERFVSRNISRQSEFQCYEMPSNFTDTFKISVSNASFQSKLNFQNEFKHEELITNHIHRKFRFQGLNDIEEISVGANCACFYTNVDSHQELVVGTREGKIKVININSFEEVLSKNCSHGDRILHVESKKPTTLLITSDADNSSTFWNFTSTDIEKIHTFNEAFHMEFGKRNMLRIITTNRNAAVIHDINTFSQLQIFPGNDLGNNYGNNTATFDFSDNLVLSDGLLYDVRSGEMLHKLEKFNSKRNGMFHPNGREIICSSLIWDVRTFKLLRRVDGLDECRITFNESGTVIYAVKETESVNCFHIFDACDYNKISTVDVKRSVRSVCCDQDNRYVAAIVEYSESPLCDTFVCRMYQVDQYEQACDDSDRDCENGSDISSNCDEEEERNIEEDNNGGDEEMEY